MLRTMIDGNISVVRQSHPTNNNTTQWDDNIVLCECVPLITAATIQLCGSLILLCCCRVLFGRGCLQRDELCDKGRHAVIRFIASLCFFSFWLWSVYLFMYITRYDYEFESSFGVISFASCLAIAALLLAVLCYTVMTLEVRYSPEYQRLSNVQTEDWPAVLEKIELMRAAKPEITFHVECWHYATATDDQRDTGRTVSGANTTAFVEKQYHYDECVDLSSGIKRGDMKWQGFTDVRFHLILCWADGNSRDASAQELESFRQEHLNRDVNVTSSIKCSFPGALRSDHVIVDGRSPVVRGLSVSRRVFMCCMLLGLAWPYRWLFQIRLRKLTYTIRKCIAVRYPTADDEETVSAAERESDDTHAARRRAHRERRGRGMDAAHAPFVVVPSAPPQTESAAVSGQTVPTAPPGGHRRRHGEPNSAGRGAGTSRMASAIRSLSTVFRNDEEVSGGRRPRYDAPPPAYVPPSNADPIAPPPCYQQSTSYQIVEESDPVEEPPPPYESLIFYSSNTFGVMSSQQQQEADRGAGVITSRFDMDIVDV